MVKRTKYSKAAAVAKKESKAALKEQKLQARNEKLLEGALAKFERSSVEGDLNYIHKALQETPGFIPPLARLLRQGALNTLLRSHDSSEQPVTDGEKWQGKARKLLDLPESAQARMLLATGLKLSTEQQNDAELVKSAFALQFWLVKETALPVHERIRHVSTLEMYAKKRVEEIGFAPLEKVAPESIQGGMELWVLDGTTLSCAFFEDEEKTLPSLPDGAQWTLSDATCPNCVATAPLDVFNVLCRSLFAPFKDLAPEKKWKYSMDAAMEPEASPNTAPLLLKAESPTKP